MSTITRRALLGATLAGGVAALPGTAFAAAAPAMPDNSARDGYAFLDLMLDAYADGEDIRLPQSYTDQVGLKTTGFTYDASVALLAYLACGTPGMIQQAHRIGRGLLYAQDHDPAFPDGRLRQAYAVEGFVLADGTVNAGGPFGFTGSYTGDQAWAGIALAALYEFTGDPAALRGALRLGTWVWHHCRSGGQLGGFADGLGKDGVSPVRNMSTSHNAALVALFGRLARLVPVTDGWRWLRARDEAAAFVRNMWNPALHRFRRGSPDGLSALHGAPSLDAQAQSWLALRDHATLDALPFVEAALTVTDTSHRVNNTLPAGKRVTGVTVSTASKQADPGTPIEPGLPKPDPYGVWFEGCAQYACALAHAPKHATPGGPSVPARLAVIADAQATLGKSQTVGGSPLPDGLGVVAASSPLSVGFDASGYYPARHVGATAWYLLACCGVNPLA